MTDKEINVVEKALSIAECSQKYSQEKDKTNKDHCMWFAILCGLTIICFTILWRTEIIESYNYSQGIVVENKSSSSSTSESEVE